MNPYDQAHALAKALRESDEYKEYVRLKQAAYDDSTNKALLDEYKKLQFKMQAKLAGGETPPQEDMQRMQQELQTREFTATVGGGAVRATAYGSKVIKSIEIDPACVDPDDVEMLQDLVLSAVNEAMRMAEEATNSEVSKLTGGMGLGF